MRTSCHITLKFIPTTRLTAAHPRWLWLLPEFALQGSSYLAGGWVYPVSFSPSGDALAFPGKSIVLVSTHSSLNTLSEVVVTSTQPECLLFLPLPPYGRPTYREPLRRICLEIHSRPHSVQSWRLLSVALKDFKNMDPSDMVVWKAAAVTRLPAFVNP